MPRVDFDAEPLSQAEKRLVLENDRKVREAEKRSDIVRGAEKEPSTYFAQAQIETIHQGRRYEQLSKPTSVGSTPGWAPPRIHGIRQDPVGQEPPLGIDVNAVEPVESEILAPEPGFGDQLEAAIRQRTILGTPSPSVQGESPPRDCSGGHDQDHDPELRRIALRAAGHMHRDWCEREFGEVVALDAA
jgi:hypothetical protein